MKLCAIAVLVGSILSAGIAGAQAAPDGSLSPVREARWYGWETLLTDAGGISAFVAAGEVQGRDMSTALVELGLATYVLGGPIVHIAEGHPLDAGKSLGIRLGAPLAGGLAGFLVGEASCAKDDGEVPCPAVTAGLGVLGGAVLAVIIDAEVISREAEPISAPTSHLAPTVSVTKNGVSAGLVGAF